MHLDNGKTTIVHINDRESFHAKRIIDFSYVSEKIGMTGTTLFV
jgi:rare lipoprotein A (peptidoglycan hydrolase)